ALKKDIEEHYKDTILKRLTETHHFDLPETLVERELTATVRQVLDSRLSQKGKAASGEDPVKRQEEIKRLRDEHRAEATRRVKVGLILEAVAEREGLTVEDEDVTNEIQRLATVLKLALEDVRRMVAAGGEESMDELKGRILADKALDFVYRHAVIQK
ncbi:MAG: hypothetical protein V3S55_05675, partial [Nitrospiraceae bacterium]